MLEGYKNENILMKELWSRLRCLDISRMEKKIYKVYASCEGLSKLLKTCKI